MSHETPDFEKYPFRIEPNPEEEGGGFFVTFPDLPGCMADGDSYEEAIANARDAFRAWMTVRAESELPLPSPNGEGVPAKFVQRLPQSLHAQLLRAAALDGASMNTLVTVFVAEGLARREGRRALVTVEQGVERVLRKLEEVKFLATVDWNTTLLMRETSGYSLSFPMTQVNTSSDVKLMQWSQPRSAITP